MIAGNGQSSMSLEDSIRQIIRDPDHRKAFRDQYPMYDTNKLSEQIEKCEKDIAQFEKAILKAQRYKRECEELIGQCKKRDSALEVLSQSNA